MADTTLRLRYPTGAILDTQIEDGEGVWNGAGYVPFQMAGWATYATATPETPPGSGRYVCPFPTGSPPGHYTWVTYLRAGAEPAPGDTPVGQGEGFWDGTTFGGSSGGDLEPVQAALSGIRATLDSYAEISPAAVVADPTPTQGGFIVAMADGSAMPETFVWRNSEAWFAGSSVLRGGKYPVASYTKLTATTARITFSPPLPVAPGNGDTLLLG